MDCMKTNPDESILINWDIVAWFNFVKNVLRQRKLLLETSTMGWWKKYILDRTFGKRKMRLSFQKHTNIKAPSQLGDILGCFSSTGTERFIATERIMKSEDYIKIPEENLSLSAQNLIHGRQFILQQDNDPKIGLNQWLRGFKKRLQSLYNLQWVLI